MKLKKLKQKKTLIISIRGIMYLNKTFIDHSTLKYFQHPASSFTYPPAK